MSFLLDTCALLDIAHGESLRAEATTALRAAAGRNEIFVSPVSAWELGKLAARGRLKLAIDPLSFFMSFAEKPGFALCDLTPDIMVKSSFLPHLDHKDPMDLMLIATARQLRLTLVTSDRVILAYGAEGYVKTLAC